MTKRSVPHTKFVNCQVVVTRGKEPGTYDVSTHPDVIKIVARDTVINYQIIPDSPPDIQFSGMTTTPFPSHQLSKPTISVDGKLLTLSDVNTVRETIRILLEFKDGLGNKMTHDPQILNEPE